MERGLLPMAARFLFLTSAENKTDSLAVMGRIALVSNNLYIIWKVPSHSSLLQNIFLNVCQGLLWNGVV